MKMTKINHGDTLYFVCAPTLREEKLADKVNGALKGALVHETSALHDVYQDVHTVYVVRVMNTKRYDFTGKCDIKNTSTGVYVVTRIGSNFVLLNTKDEDDFVIIERNNPAYQSVSRLFHTTDEKSVHAEILRIDDAIRVYGRVEHE
jgi:hypothetical protein